MVVVVVVEVISGRGGGGSIKGRRNVIGILKASKLEWKHESFEFLLLLLLLSC